MTVENNMQNPGDLRVPEGVVVEPKRKILVVKNGSAALVKRVNYDVIVELGGSETTEKDENVAIADTTYPLPVKKGT